MRDLLIPQFKNPHQTEDASLSQRLEDALGNSDIPDLQSDTETIEIDASGTVSDVEFFQQKDFRMMIYRKLKQLFRLSNP